MDDYGVDLDEITRVIDRADVLIVRFQMVEKRFLADFRTSAQEGPLVRAVSPAASVEERFRSLRALRPRFPLPERVLSFLWPRSLATFQEAGVLDLLAKRLAGVEPPATDGELGEVFQALRLEEQTTVAAAIQGGEGFQTLWERRA